MIPNRDYSALMKDLCNEKIPKMSFSKQSQFSVDENDFSKSFRNEKEFENSFAENESLTDKKGGLNKNKQSELDETYDMIGDFEPNFKFF